MSETLENAYIGNMNVLKDDLAAIIIAVPEDYILDQMKVFDQAVVTNTNDGSVAADSVGRDQKVYRFRFRRDVDASDREPSTREL